jgi:hypothetical protein
VAHASLGHALALRGEGSDLEEAVRHGEEAIRLYGYEEDAMDSDFATWLLVRIYVLAGRTDEAFALMKELVSRPNIFGRGDLRLDPLYDDLRNDPRFADLERTLDRRTER